MLLLEPPGGGRDGRQLRLELDGYEVIASWDPAEAAAVADVAFACLVLGTATDAERWRRLTEAAAPILVLSDASGSDLVALGLHLRESDFLIPGTAAAAATHPGGGR